MHKSSDIFIKNKPYKIPDNIITEEQYREIMDAFAAYPTFSEANEEYLQRLDNFTEQAKDMIRHCPDTVTQTGDVYYVANCGDDNADGKSPETAWATYDKLNSFEFKSGDTVLFNRGDIWRGMLEAKNGVTYSAYGTGPKPKLLAAYDGLGFADWIKTEHENIWMFDTVLEDMDIPTIVFNGEKAAKKKLKFEDLKENYDFFYCSDFAWVRPENCEQQPNNRLYLYLDKGNPADLFDDIEVNMCAHVINSVRGSHDITYHNLELLYGNSPIWTEDSKNIKISYCVMGWCGGRLWTKAKKGNNTRLGGGVCTWHGCENISFDHCYFYQQFDSGVTPQYHWKGEQSAQFINYRATDCIFETTKWTFEWFNTQQTKDDNCFKNIYFGYNICRTGGYGYGDRNNESAYVKSWGHENVCYNFEISHNIFDRAFATSIEIISHAPGKRGKNVSYEHLPKLNSNVYIEPKNKEFANINHIFYKFNQASHITLEKLGVETGAVYVFCEKKEEE